MLSYSVAGLIVVLLPCGLIALNVWHYRHRKSLTPEERAAEDEEIRDEGRIR